MHSATKYSPFQIVYGFSPLSPLDLTPLPLSERTSLDGKQKAELVKKIHEEARANIEAKTKKYAEYKNRGRRRMIFGEGDLVWVHLRKDRFPDQRKSKLMPRIDGPFKITRKLNDNSYQLDLQGKYNISNSFNVADLAPFVADEPDLRSNPFQEGGDGVILTKEQELDQDQELEQGEGDEFNDKDELFEDQGITMSPHCPKSLHEAELEAEEAMTIPTGPITRSKSKELQRAINGVLHHIQEHSTNLQQVECKITSTLTLLQSHKD